MHRRWRRQVKNRLRRRIRAFRAGTVLISFPKCGRTWLRLMMGEAIDAQFGLGATGSEKLDLEALGASRRGVPRILVSHGFDHLADTSAPVPRATAQYRRKRVILLVRDPRDAIVSLYFESRKRQPRRVEPYGGSLGEFLREPAFSTAALLDFYKRWAKDRDVPRDVLLVRYEDLHRDPVGELGRVLRYIGIDAVTDGVIESAVAATTFDRMHELERADALASKKMRPGASGDEDSFKTRRGEVGAYADYLAPSDIGWLDTQIGQLDPWFGYSSPSSGATSTGEG